MILAGYSYGAMVTSQIPPLASILSRFESPATASHAGNIRTKAETLAAQQREILSTGPAMGRRSLRIGEGSSGGSPRRSHEHGRRSLSLDDAEDKLRRGVRDFMAKTRHLSPHGSERVGGSFHDQSHHHHHKREKSVGAPSVEVTLSQVTDLVPPRAAYLLISPLQGLITHLATMSRAPGDEGSEKKLRDNPTLAVFGNADVFVAASKLRAWTERMEGANGSRFTGSQVDGAGHFWVEEGVMDRMSGLVNMFAEALIQR